MAENVKETVLSIRVDSAQAVQQLADYSALIAQCREREKELQKSIKEGNDVSGEQAKELLAVIEARKQYTRQTQIASKEVQNNIAQSKAQEGSLKSLRALLSNLTKEYDELSRAQREGAKGKELQEQINGITKELKSGEEGTQRFYRNVGNYAGSMEGLFGQLQNNAKQALGGFQLLGIGAKAALGPIGIVIGAVVGAIQFFNKALHSSEELSMATGEAFAFLKSGTVALQRIMQGAGKIILNIWKSISGAIGKAANWVAKLLGKEKEWTEYKEERLALQTELTEQVKEENRITLEQRKINEKNAESELKIAKLRAEAADKANLTAQERIRILREAGEEEKRMSERNYALAKREYELQKRKSDLAGNSAEENEKLSQAYTKMIQAQTAYFNKSREITAQISEATAKVMAEQAKLAAERKKAYEEMLADASEFFTEMVRIAEEDLAKIDDDLIQQSKNKEAEAKLRGENALAEKLATKALELSLMHKLEEESEAEFQARLLAKKQEYADAAAAIAEYEKQVQISKYTAIANAMGALSDLIGEFSEDSKEAAIASKALALGVVAIQQGVAIAQAVATATRSSATWIDMLAAIAAVVAGVTATIVPAVKMIKTAKFSTGGYVSGEGSGTSDSIPAMLSNGESVNNARSTSMFSPLYSSLNQMGGGVPIIASQTASQVQGEEMLARAFAKGMSEANIRVGVDEITRVQNRVKVVENLGAI